MTSTHKGINQMQLFFKKLLFTCGIALLSSATFGQFHLELEGGVSTAGRTLAEAIRHSRNSMIGQTKPLPPEVREKLKDFFPNSVLDRARFKIGDDGAFNVARNTLFNSHVAAVTLDDVIVFRSADDAKDNLELWAHELKHVHQYLEWGVNSFATQYVRNSGTVEREASEYQARVSRVLNKNLGAGCTTARELVGHLYRFILERDGEEAGVRDNVLLLNTGKISVRQLVAGFVDGKEHRDRFAAGRPSEQQVRNLYKHVLAREGDAPGVTTNTNALNGSDYKTIVNAFVNSAEYSNRFGDWIAPSVVPNQYKYCG